MPIWPERTNKFFFELIVYVRAKVEFQMGTYDEWHDNSFAMYECIDDYKRFDVGKGGRGVVGLPNIV